MVCSKLNGKFLKIRAKVSGFLIAKVEKRNTSEKSIVVTIKSKKNTILTSGLQDLLNAFTNYMSGLPYNGANAPSSGIVLTISSGQTITLSFSQSPTISAGSNTAVISFTAEDTSVSSYTAISEQLVTTSAGYNIPIATASLPVTKQSDEILSLTWIITVTISTSGGIIYVPAVSPQAGGVYCSGSSGGCHYCASSSASSEYSQNSDGCSLHGVSAIYPETNFVVTQLFSDMFYNTYSTKPANSFTSYVNTTLYIYTQYCMQYFFAGLYSGESDFASYDPSNGYFCCSNTNAGLFGVYPIYLQVYYSTETQPYIGVEIVFTT